MIVQEDGAGEAERKPELEQAVAVEHYALRAEVPVGEEGGQRGLLHCSETFFFGFIRETGEGSSVGWYLLGVKTKFI